MAQPMNYALILYIITSYGAVTAERQTGSPNYQSCAEFAVVTCSPTNQTLSAFRPAQRVATRSRTRQEHAPTIRGKSGDFVHATFRAKIALGVKPGLKNSTPS
jgi:hypothetical protein